VDTELDSLLPDPRRLYRRITASNLPTRLVSHLVVLSLVVVAATAGLAQSQTDGGSTAGDSTGFFVTAVRGADDAPASPKPSSLLQAPAEATSGESAALPLPGEDAAAVDRGAPAVAPSVDQPMPTPAPVDPDATPIPPPTTALGQAGSSSGGTAGAPSTRAAAAPAAVGGLVWPVSGGSVSQYFHAGHLAVDIAAPYGNAVVAAQGGVVTWAAWRNNGGGYVISIDHGNGMVTTYNHLGTVYVSPGQYVAAGQTIAPVGCTGICTGPHVHFEIRTNGAIDNPMRYF
jgi:murein DD-endopeptidase MepM/ murein hydrolase activator NlpD